MSPRRPALIFDFGNVVAFFDYAVACDTYGRRLGMTGEALLTCLRDRGLLGVVHAFESGKLAPEEFTRSVGRLAGLDLDHDEFARNWADIFTLNRPVADLLAALKRAGHRLVLGSNTNEIHARQFRRQFADTLAHFDRLVLSYEVGHLKPSAPFYLACAEAAGAAPQDCLFIDDLPENVAGARQAGLDAILFHEIDALVAALRERGVEFDGQR